MTEQPNICVDIFTNIANMLGSLNSLANGPAGSGEFTHGSGFQTQMP
jgi:hypothetical protein